MTTYRLIEPYKISPPPEKILLEVQDWLKSSNAPLVVEIGSGVGLHPITFAKLNLDHRILAIERTNSKFSKFNRRLSNHCLQNIFGVQAEATRLLPHLLTKNSVQHYFFLYPNPYPKNKHQNLRWGHSAFMPFVFKTLKPGGTVTFATNIISYAEELAEQLPLLGFSLISFEKVPADSRRTHFEIKYLRDGQTCYNLVFGKPT